MLSLRGMSEHEKATAQGYDRWASCYDDRDPSTWLDEPFLLQHLLAFPRCRILDLGCGTGRYMRLLPESGCRIVGVDLSRNMLGRTQDGVAGRTDIRLVQASVTSLPFVRGCFDRVISGLVIDHVASAERLFREIAFVLTSQGHAIIAAVHPAIQRITGCDIEIAADTHDAIRIPGCLHEVDDLLEAARHAGLTLIAKEEPEVTAAMLERRPDWRKKLRCPMLLLLVLAKG
jgi:ubiquinone/menaquinone biosynthesis C-methylase UbiE